MSRKKLARQIERRRERRQETREAERRKQAAHDLWFGSEASYRRWKAINKDADIADNEKLAVFEAEMCREKPKAERSFMESVYIWMVDRRKAAVFKAFASLCGFAYNITDKKPFMTALRAASYVVIAGCAWAAVETGLYGKYLCCAVVIFGLSYLCPKFTSEAADKRSRRFMDSLNSGESAVISTNEGERT